MATLKKSGVKILVVDLETSSLSPKKGQIVEIGMALLDVNTGNIKRLYESLVYNGDGLDEDAWIFKNSDLTPEQVYDAKPLDKEVVQSYLNDYPVTAFNRPFDFSFLEAAGLNIPNKYECVMQIAKETLQSRQRISMEKAYRKLFSDEYVEKHRAMEDAVDEAKILHECLLRRSK